MQSYWWVWFPVIEPQILEPTKISAGALKPNSEIFAGSIRYWWNLTLTHIGNYVYFLSPFSKLPNPHFQVSGRPLSSEERDLLPVVTSPLPWWTSTGQSSLEGTNVAVGSMMSTYSILGPW